MWLDGGKDCLEALGVARNDLALFKVFMAASEVTDQAAGFLNQQGACGHVPFGQAKLPKRVIATGRDIGQIQASSPGAAKPCGLPNQASEHIEVAIEIVQLAIAERESRAEKCAFQALACTDAQAASVECRAATPAGSKLFLANRIDHHGVFEAATIFSSDADCVVRYAA